MNKLEQWARGNKTDAELEAAHEEGGRLARWRARKALGIMSVDPAHIIPSVGYESGTFVEWPEEFLQRVQANMRPVDSHEVALALDQTPAEANRVAQDLISELDTLISLPNSGSA